MKLFAIACLVLVANTNGKHIKHRSQHRVTDEDGDHWPRHHVTDGHGQHEPSLTDAQELHLTDASHGHQPHHADEQDVSDVIDLGLLNSDLIQEITNEIKEENEKLQSVKEEVKQLETDGANFWKRAMVWIDQGKIEQKIRNLGETLKRNIKENYDEDSLKKMQLQLFRK